MSIERRILGIVEDGKFMPLDPKSSEQIRLTKISMQTAMTPEGGELDLKEHERTAIMISGIDDGDWIYSAKVIDKVGPILTEVVKKIFK